MLKRLVISNYALIDSLEIDLQDGLSIVTGETGAGKSIILGALSMILGQRAELRVVRNKEKKSVIEAVFDISRYSLSSFFKENDLEYDPEECILRREIQPNGRSRAFVNDTPVTLNQLADLASRLVDIHSQHSNALLLTPSYQLRVIDSLASNRVIRDRYAEAFEKYVGLVRRLKDTRARIERNRLDEEYFRFQHRQLAELNLEEGEQAELEAERNMLANVSEIKAKLWDACDALGDGNRNAIGLLGVVSHRLESLAGLYEAADESARRIDSVQIELKDIYETLRKDADSLTDDPEALERIEDRLNAIYALQQKHHVVSVEELIEIQRRLEKDLSEIECSENEIQGLESEVADARDAVADAAAKLTESRERAAGMFAEQLQAAALPLGLTNLVCKIDFERTEFERTGQDRLQFLFAFNRNQEPMPIEKTASGGEISRLMLCIKSIIAEKMQLPSIIFDEIDTGVSGEVANRIGEKMKQISSRIQVIAITHLPQVAALGDRHFKVYKRDVGDATVTGIRELDQEARVLEIAGMLSGSSVDEAAINNAKSLLRLS